MFTSRNAKRFMAIGLALAITFLTNFAISYAEKSGGSTPGGDIPVPRIALELRSGGSTPGGDIPIPKTALQTRSGGSTPGGDIPMP